jgi:hypothetical protein
MGFAVDTDTLLLSDYEIKVRYYSDTMQRVWTRFNFFLTVQSGLAAGLVFSQNDGAIAGSAIYFLIVEAFLSLIWWVFGAQDRWTIATLRAQVAESWNLLANMSSCASVLPAGYPHAGQIEGDPLKETLRTNRPQWVSPAEWRWQRISITRLPAVVPLLLFVIWLALIGVYVATR